MKKGQSEIKAPSEKMRKSVERIVKGKDSLAELQDSIQYSIDELKTRNPQLHDDLNSYLRQAKDLVFEAKDTMESAEWISLSGSVKQRLKGLETWYKMSDLYDMDKSLARYKLTREDYRSRWLSDPNEAEAYLAEQIRNKESYNLSRILKIEAPTAITMKYKDQEFENASNAFYSDIIDAFDDMIELRGLDEHSESIPELDRLLSKRDDLIARKQFENNLVFDMKAGTTLMLGPYVGFKEELKAMAKKVQTMEDELAELQEKKIGAETALKQKEAETQIVENSRLDKLREIDMLMSDIKHLQESRATANAQLLETERRVTARVEQLSRAPYPSPPKTDQKVPQDDNRGKTTAPETAPITAPKTALRTAKGTAAGRQKDGSNYGTKDGSEKAVKTPGGYVWVADDPDGKHPSGTNVRVAVGKDGRHRCVKADGHSMDGSIDHAQAIMAGVTT